MTYITVCLRVHHLDLFVQDDPKQRKPDITTAGEQLGWKPVVRIIFFLCVDE